MYITKQKEYYKVYSMTYPFSYTVSSPQVVRDVDFPDDTNLYRRETRIRHICEFLVVLVIEETDKNHKIINEG